MKKFILTAVAAAAIAMSAQAQTELTLAGGTSYTLTSVSAGSGTGSVSYQWYRNGAAISGATSASYTLPGNLAHGYRVEFKRGAKTSSCPDYTSSNAYILTFYMQVGSLKWATTNLMNNTTMAERPDMYTNFFQWNTTASWPPSNVNSGWSVILNQSSTWNNNPCPAGWRVPTRDEYITLYTLGSTWVNANAKGNAVAGCFFGVNHASCNLTSSMTSCIFLPASGYRRDDNGSYTDNGVNGNYWSGTHSDAYQNYGFRLFINSSNSVTIETVSKSFGLSIRCVQ